MRSLHTRSVAARDGFARAVVQSMPNKDCDIHRHHAVDRSAGMGEAAAVMQRAQVPVHCEGIPWWLAILPLAAEGCVIAYTSKQYRRCGAR